MSPTKLRWGLLGVAGINDRLMPAFKASQTVDLAAIASRSLDKAKAAAAKDGIPKAYGSYEALLADPNIDAVYIPLPNHLHAEWTRKAADAGKHILCEKPLCVTAIEAETLVEYCRKKDVRLMDGFMWPHHPRTHKIRRFLSDGGIGPVKSATAAFTFDLEGLPPSNIRMKPEAGGGSLLDVGCYCVYAIRWVFLAEPVSAYARAVFSNGVDVSVAAILTFADGRTASFDCGFTKPLRTWVEIVGATGVVRIPNLWIPDDRAAYEVQRQSGLFDQAAEVVETPGEDQMVHMLDDFAKHIADVREAYPNPNEAVLTLKVLDALARSAREGKEIEV